MAGLRPTVVRLSMAQGKSELRRVACDRAWWWPEELFDGTSGESHGLDKPGYSLEAERSTDLDLGDAQQQEGDEGAEDLDADGIMAGAEEGRP